MWVICLSWCFNTPQEGSCDLLLVHLSLLLCCLHANVPRCFFLQPQPSFPTKSSVRFLSSLSVCDSPTSQHSNCCFSLSNFSSCHIVHSSLSSSDFVHSAWGQMLLAELQMTHWDNVDRHQRCSDSRQHKIRWGIWSCCGESRASVALVFLCLLLLFDNVENYHCLPLALTRSILESVTKQIDAGKGFGKSGFILGLNIASLDSNI